MSLVQRYRRYVDNDDPLAASSNFIALMVAASQPFYPLYVYWVIGGDYWPTLFTFFSTPFFLAVPALARSNSLAGRALLPIAGIANTALASLLLGPQSGVLLFLMACVLIAAVQFRKSERWCAFLLVAAATAAYFLLKGTTQYALVDLSDSAATGLIALNAFSVGALLVISGFSFADAIRNDRHER
jgi:hypothetical protein